MDKGEELAIAMATLEASFIDSIKDHTEHTEPKILEPYDLFEIKGDRLVVFSEDEIPELLALEEMKGIENLLVYCAESKRFHGWMPISTFLDSDVDKMIGLDGETGQIWGITNIKEPAIASLEDRGFWGFFEGDDGNKYFFSRGQSVFAVDQMLL